MRPGIRYVVALALSTTLTGCIQMGGAPPPAAATGAGEIAFTLAGTGGAAVVVPVHINNSGPYQFVLDTGATLTCVDRSLAEQLNLPKPVGMIGYGATLGEAGTVGLHRIDTIRVGETSATKLTACAIDLENIRKAGLEAQGLLGLNFLKAFKVTLDFERRVMTLAAVP